MRSLVDWRRPWGPEAMWPWSTSRRDVSEVALFQRPCVVEHFPAELLQASGRAPADSHIA